MQAIFRSRDALLVVLIALGAVLRLGPALRADFPLNDGGMFLRMVEEVQQARYMLPVFTSYNGMHIPFAYPPLGFYLAAGGSDALGVAPIDVLRVLPAVLTTLALSVFAIAARSVLRSSVGAATATLAFAIAPCAYEWMIMGGGLTRSVGMLSAVLALYWGWIFFRTGSRSTWVGMCLASAATILSHMDWTLFL